ncbi:AAA family ATPase [Delftia acidovorans]
MLAKFEVENFKNFEKTISLDLTKSSGYEFNKECVINGIINKAIIYGYNGSGKSNIGFAIFDIVSNFTDKNNGNLAYKNYTFAGSKNKIARFKYEFIFNEFKLIYEYGKTDLEKIVHEEITINDSRFAHIDRRINNIAEINAAGAESLKTDIGESQISIVSYISKNSVLEKDPINECFNEFKKFVNGMLFFRSLEKNNYIGYEQGSTEIGADIIARKNVKDFEKFINDAGIDCKLVAIKNEESSYLAVEINGKKVPFFGIASQGTKALALFYYWYQKFRDSKSNISLIFVDEFDSFYHQDLSLHIIKILKSLASQVILTTHNTSVMTNDLLRPDCYFFINKKGIHSLSNRTDKELREAHNIEKMYRAGAFGE